MHKSVLIVEDDPLLSQALSEILLEAGYSVLTATRLSDALQKTNNQKFGCILMDLQLETGSGLKVVQQIRSETAQESLNFNTPIILMSGHLAQDVVLAAAGKVQAVLAKPFSMKEILNKVNEFASLRLSRNVTSSVAIPRQPDRLKKSKPVP